MWLVAQVAVNEPSGATTALTVGAHCQPVWLPSRSISTVWPESLDEAAP